MDTAARRGNQKCDAVYFGTLSQRSAFVRSQIRRALDEAQSATRAEKIRSDLENGSVNKVFVVAHRAAWKNALENSRLAVEHAIEMGVDIVEIDIRRTKDGVFVLMQDDRGVALKNKKGKKNSE